MKRVRLTSPGVLLILAVIAAGGIFLLDLFYLEPHMENQKWATLREQAVRVEHGTQVVLQSNEDRLLRYCVAWGQTPQIARSLKGHGVAGEMDKFVSQVFDSTEVEIVWISDEAGLVTHGWRRKADKSVERWLPSEMDQVQASIRTLRGFDDRPPVGLIGLPAGVAICARHPIYDGQQPSETLGYLWIARLLNRSLLQEIGSAVGGDLVLVAGNSLPQGRRVESPALHTMWLAGDDHLAVAWLARSLTGKTLGYFNAMLPVVHIHRQASAARRMVLIILSLAVGLSLLVIMGAHILIAGPVFRLLQRLQLVEDGEGTVSSLVRDLHGEPLMLARRLESAFDRLARISKTDELTEVANRRHFEEVLECFYHQARRYNRPLSLMVMDVDFFKAVNDVAGHPAGDEVLKQVATVVEQVCRKSDLPARFGGDEFAVLLPETLASDALGVAERIRTAVMELSVDTKVEMNVTISIGLTDLNAAEIDSPEAMIRVADRALYRAKEMGRNRIITTHDMEGAVSPTESSKVDTLYKKLAGLDCRFKSFFLLAIQEIVEVLERRDPHMADHARKVQHYAVLTAQEMGLPERIVNRVQMAAMLHDVGMLVMPDAVLLCRGQLDGTELQIMRRHPLLSVRIMEGMEFLEQEIPAVRYHHERYDGKGYPEGIRGAAIPLTARILTVADCFDAMTTSRTFRQAMPLAETVAELKRNAGTQFDPVVVEALVAVVARLGEKIFDVPCLKGSTELEEMIPQPQGEPANA